MKICYLFANFWWNIQEIELGFSVPCDLFSCFHVPQWCLVLMKIFFSPFFRYLQQRALSDKTFTYEVGIDCIISFHVITALVFSVKHDMNIGGGAMCKSEE